jgi:hypothetical protein
MTNNISVNFKLDDGSITYGTNVLRWTPVGNHYIAQVQAVGTSYELLQLGDCTSVKMLYLENASTASFQVAYDNAGSKVCATLSALGSGSHFALFPPSASNASGIYVKASQAADLIVGAYEV